MGVSQFISEGPSGKQMACPKYSNLRQIYLQETIKVWVEGPIQLKPTGAWVEQEKGTRADNKWLVKEGKIMEIRE